jgi:hypothetical protein
MLKRTGMYYGFKVKNQKEYDGATAYLKSFGLTGNYSTQHYKFSTGRAVVWVRTDAKDSQFDLADNHSSVGSQIGNMSFGEFLTKHSDLLEAPVKVQINDELIALVRKDKVIVGCREFKPERVLALADEVRKQGVKQAEQTGQAKPDALWPPPTPPVLSEVIY